MPTPKVDISELVPGDPAVGVALVETGFAILEGHGIDPHRWQRTYEAAERAFALPAATKASYQGPADGSQRGFLPVRTTLADGRPALDRKEAWNARAAGHRYENIFPAEVPELEPAALQLIGDLDHLLERVLMSLDAFLGNPLGHFAEMVRGSDSLFRINHYPEQNTDTAELRFRPHRDFDLITFVLGANRPGLQVQASDGSWQALTPSPTGIILNAGDILQVESEAGIPSTTHRVVWPDDPDGGRTSIVYFVAPREEVQLVNGLSAGDFIDARLRNADYLR